MRKIRMLRFMFLLLAVLLLVLENNYAQSPFTPGNIVVTRLGDGINNYANQLAPVFLDEYTPTGNFVQSIALPTADNGANKTITMGYGSADRGILNRSADGRYLTLLGYTIPPGPGPLDGASYPLAIARIDFNGLINTSTTIPQNQNVPFAPAGVITNDGTGFWSVQQGSGGGIFYSLLGQSTSQSTVWSTSVAGTPYIYNGQLYNTAGGTIIKIGNGLPTGPATPSLVMSSSTSGLCQVVFADLDPTVSGFDVIYEAQNGAGGLRKFSLVNGTWTVNGLH